MAAQGISLNHISRESSDVKRLAKFYQEVGRFLGSRKWRAPTSESLRLYGCACHPLPCVSTSSSATQPTTSPRVHGVPRHPLRTPLISPEAIISASPSPISIPFSTLSRTRVLRLFRNPCLMGRSNKSSFSTLMVMAWRLQAGKTPSLMCMCMCHVYLSIIYKSIIIMRLIIDAVVICVSRLTIINLWIIPIPSRLFLD